MTEEEIAKIRSIIAEEISKKLTFAFENIGHEGMGLKILIKYDDQQLVYEDL